jgi:amino acid permease
MIHLLILVLINNHSLIILIYWLYKGHQKTKKTTKKKPNKQTNKQTNKQKKPNKQTNKQINKQTNKKRQRWWLVVRQGKHLDPQYAMIPFYDTNISKL